MKSLYVLGLVGLVAAGCAKKNPLEGRQPGVIQRPVEQGPQKYLICTAEVVTPSSIVAVEGHSVLQPVFIRGLNAKATGNLVVQGNAEGVRVQRVGNTSEGLKFNVTFSPKRGTIPNGENYLAYNVRLQPTSELDLGKNCGESVSFAAIRSNEVPVIKSNNMPKTLDLNSDSVTMVTIQVVAKDLSNRENLRLHLDFDESTSSQENPVYPLQRAIEKTGPVKVGTNTYNFVLTIYPQTVREILAQQMKTAANEFELSVQLTAKNREAFSAESPAINLKTKFKRPAAKVETKGANP